MKRFAIIFLLGAIAHAQAAGQATAKLNVVPFSATPTFDASIASQHRMVLTGNVSSSAIPNLTNGQVVTVELCQDATGGRTFAWPSNTTGGPTISSTANVCTAQAFLFDGQTAVATSSGGGAPSGAAGGDLSGTYPNPGVAKVNGAAVPASGFGLKTNSSNQFVAAPGAYASGTTTTSITAATLCTTTNCPAGNYLISVYVNEVGTGCTTVTTGAVKVQVNFIDNQATSRVAFVPTQTSTGGIYAITGTSFTTVGNASGTGFLLVNTNGSAVAGSDSIQIQSVVTACATPGSWTGYQVRAFITPVGPAN